MQGAKVYSKFDLKNGYNLLRVKPEDVWKTAFMTPDGPFVMNVMAFGFANAPAYFQRWMSDILAPVINQRVENYLDDTATHHLDLGEHIRVNREVLKCFRKAGLFINARKCEFHKERMGFLGVEISPKGFEMERVKIEAIQDWRPPRNVRGVREFIGFCNFYRRFIKSFSEIARPLHDLTKVGQLWQWTENEQHTFDTLKNMICESPVLIHVDPTHKFQMETDASSYAYGAILSQKATDNKHHPVAFYSKTMTPAERNYSISDKEALPILKGLQFWRHWLEGTKEPIRIITDHRNLEYFKNPDPSTDNNFDGWNSSPITTTKSLTDRATRIQLPTLSLDERNSDPNNQTRTYLRYSLTPSVLSKSPSWLSSRNRIRYSMEWNTRIPSRMNRYWSKSGNSLATSTCWNGPPITNLTTTWSSCLGIREGFGCHRTSNSDVRSWQVTMMGR
jgi:hypothetical protein